MTRARAKMYSIKDIVRQKRIWVEKYDQFPYHYWRRRWDFLCRQLAKLSDMQRDFRYSRKGNLETEVLNESKKDIDEEVGR